MFIRINGRYSLETDLSSGTPQGAVLSLLLFNLTLSDIPHGVYVQRYVYADDITLSCCSNNIKEAAGRLQCYLKEFVKWVDMWGLEINYKKTYIQCYTRQRIVKPIVRINNRVITYQKVHKLLGLLYDSPLLTWRNHVKELRIVYEEIGYNEDYFFSYLGGF